MVQFPITAMFLVSAQPIFALWPKQISIAGHLVLSPWAKKLGSEANLNSFI
jgi:hypothetical protein